KELNYNSLQPCFELNGSKKKGLTARKKRTTLMRVMMMIQFSCREEKEEDGFGEDEVLSGDNKENEVQR
ncbi:hypothetical protein, partial [Proteus vulgaris]|uniref:hypothetical protein n=1 Tax=Proteus vulgaris TaxID=585 RepID=UPI002555EE23